FCSNDGYLHFVQLLCRILGVTTLIELVQGNRRQYRMNLHLLSMTGFIFMSSYGLEKHFRDDLYDDFEQLTLEFYKKGNLYGLEKYWAFHHYREDRGSTEPLRKHPELERLLREEYRSLDDFRAKEKVSGKECSSSSSSRGGGSNG
ncbi:hypothetical protein GW17_00060413, partial [Ensete ventricosum]